VRCHKALHMDVHKKFCIAIIRHTLFTRSPGITEDMHWAQLCACTKLPTVERKKAEHTFDGLMCGSSLVLPHLLCVAVRRASQQQQRRSLLLLAQMVCSCW
jgi:hypothetical protein